MNKSVEEIIEELKAEFTTVEFKVGSVGFMITRGYRGMTFPYELFQDPNYRMAIDNAVTILEVNSLMDAQINLD
jgi:hypothetical protein